MYDLEFGMAKFRRAEWGLWVWEIPTDRAGDLQRSRSRRIERWGEEVKVKVEVEVKAPP